MDSNTIESKERNKPNSYSFRERMANYIADISNFTSYSQYFIKSVIALVFRHPMTGTNIIPVLADGRIVLTRRHDTGLWALPGGMIEWGEEIATTVRRELLEETGLELVCISRLVGVYSKPDRDPRVHSICVVVEAEVQGKINIRDRQEITEVKAFELQNLPLFGLSYDNDDHLKDYLANLTTVA
jgi:ADP-ribose pyrophosphatase YjhB (NUDIX family)